ncbi:oxidoreductase [Comamonas serinivorans]|uniref:Oxidoreductase n=1 Tax=Comamonas serinivorans TaxID=1082851 RepID=A0A1Y0EP05_9BURK|nr:NADH:flavin oxidoreductase/NADH oxidase [Comamonas serinivorans]ARU05363.1 oxidoreductase [Comamonas serinivorans]
MSHLFSPIALGPLTLPNRIVVAPMCQYSADDGRATAWHWQHWANMSLANPGLFIVEATAVSPAARISWADLGLWDDGCEDAIAGALRFARGVAPHTAMAIQLAHAGRKASTEKPWVAQGQLIPPHDPHGWQTVAPSALPFRAADPAPHALSEAEIDAVVDDFAAAARRSVRLGFDAIEVHGAHGYLLHQFLTPLANQRTDAWGGSLAGRMRLALRVFDAVRAAAPDIAVGMRISATDWVNGGWDLTQSVALATALQARGCDFLHVSSGGADVRQQLQIGPGYQVPFAGELKRALADAAAPAATPMPVITVGLITEPSHAEDILVRGEADAIGLARAMLYNPRWPWHAAAELGASLHAPAQYLRCEPLGHRGLLKPD